MSHYNTSNTGTGSWQSQNNTKTTSNSNQSLEQQHNNLSGLYNNSAAASLLAQFSALNSVNLNNLAANLPALITNQNSNSSNSTSTGYHWHSQNRLAQSNSNNQSNSSNNNNNNNNNNNSNSNSNSNSNNNNSAQNNSQSYLLGPGGIMTNSVQKQNGNSSLQVNKNDPRPLMDVKSKNNYNSSNSSASSSNNNNKQNQYQTNSSRYDPRDRNNSRYSNQTNSSSSASSSSNSNLNPPSINPLTNINPNPLLAQALLNQLNSNSNSSALVAAALAVATQQQQQINNSSPKDNRTRSRTKSRSRSPSRNSSNRNFYQKANSNRKSRSRSPSKRVIKQSSQTRELSKEHSKREEPVKHSYSSSSSSRYSIKLPKYSLDQNTTNVTNLKRNFPSLYIPSDFTNAKNTWLNSLPMNRSLKFNSKCSFHIMNKDAQCINQNKSILEPADLDHKWNVKVMLLSMPSIEDFYKRCCSFAEDNSKDLNSRLDHPNRVIQFLVGTKNKHDLMALGGPWSPSLDGPSPASNTQTLINTAIRTVHALTGLDLSPCTQWFRFLDIQYNRNEEFCKIVRKNILNQNGVDQVKTSVEADELVEKVQENILEEEELSLNDDGDVETTVIFLPNVWSLMPTSIEYEKILEEYKYLIDNDPKWFKEQSQSDEFEQTQNSPQTEASIASSLKENNETVESTDLTINSLIKSATEVPTHYSKLDLKKMKVDELRAELSARSLDTKGLKPQLLARLKDAIQTEKEKDGIKTLNESKDNLEELNESSNQPNLSQTNEEEEAPMQLDTNQNIEKENENKEENSNQCDNNQSKVENSNGKTDQAQSNTTKLSRHEKERLYRLPSIPHIIIHPSSTAKQNKFDCQLISLHSLLDYRKDDNKESSFEVFLFAECFNDMLLRDHGFSIYKHLLSLKEEQNESKNNLPNGNKRKINEEDTNENKKSKPNETETNEQKESKEIRESSSPSVGTVVSQTRQRPKTIYPDLLLSFTYLDTNRSNYIYEKDLEDLLYLIGLNLPRSKVKALFKKLNIRDGLLNYRSLTDKSNCSFYKLPSDDNIIQSIISFDSYLNRLNLKQNETTNNTAIIELNGTTIDVVSTIKKLEKSENNLGKLDQKYKELHDEFERLKIINKNLERNKLKLQDEASDLKKKLRDNQKMNKEIDDKYLRLKDFVYRTKSQLNRVLDDLSDVTRKNQSLSSQKTSSSDLKPTDNCKSEKNQDSSEDSKQINNLNENSQESINLNSNENSHQNDETNKEQEQAQESPQQQEQTQHEHQEESTKME